MVQRARLLLNRCVLMFLGGTLIGCSVDTLKIYTPSRGLESIHQEDLKRALWKLEQGTDPMSWWIHRADQVHLKSTDIHGCFVHEGNTSDMVTVLAAPTPIQVATLASMGKALDKVETPHGWQFCIQEEDSLRSKSFDNRMYVSDMVEGNPSFVDVNFEQWTHQIRDRMKMQGLR